VAQANVTRANIDTSAGNGGVAIEASFDVISGQVQDAPADLTGLFPDHRSSADRLATAFFTASNRSLIAGNRPPSRPPRAWGTTSANGAEPCRDTESTG
jgi:hypothetical protein